MRSNGGTTYSQYVLHALSNRRRPAQEHSLREEEEEEEEWSRE